MAESELIQTGIYGLDSIFLGGIFKGNVILVEGAPGTGKTLTGVEFIYRGITEYQEPGIIVVFEMSPSKLMRDAAGFGWDLEALQQQNRLKIIFTSPPRCSARSCARPTACCWRPPPRWGRRASSSTASRSCARCRTTSTPSTAARATAPPATANSCNN